MSSSETAEIEADLEALRLEHPSPGVSLRNNPNTTLPPYAQLINHVAGMIMDDELLEALNLADDTVRLYPTDFTRASISMLRAQIYAKQSKWELSKLELDEARKGAVLVRDAGRKDHVAQMAELDFCANQLQAIIHSQLNPGMAVERNDADRADKKEKKRKKKRGAKSRR